MYKQKEPSWHIGNVDRVASMAFLPIWPKLYEYIINLCVFIYLCDINDIDIKAETPCLPPPLPNFQIKTAHCSKKFL